MKKQGSVLGGILLISGSCIGAGMLANPVIMGLGGFFPSLSMMLLAWAFMSFTGLLIVEINGWFTKRVNIISMAEHGLGKFGRILSWFLYLFLFYSLLVGYIAVCGSMLSNLLESILSIHLSDWVFSLVFVGFFGSFVYLGTKAVDGINRLLMVGLITSFFLMVSPGLFKIAPSYLLYADKSYLIASLPILIVSFGFHNMIPTLTHYLDNDLKKMRIVVIVGSFLALAVYLLWNILVLGIVPVTGENGLLQLYSEGKSATEGLKIELQSGWVSLFAQSFGFFAIVTSFVAQALALVHFIGDGLKVSVPKSKSYLLFLALTPPTAFALLYPNIFYSALSFAGGICAVILFGLFPALIAYKGRYFEKICEKYQVFGKKPLLVFVLAFSIYLVAFEIYRLF